MLLTLVVAAGLSQTPLFKVALTDHPSSRSLDTYQLQGEPVAMPGIQNASGLTYNSDTNTLFAVLDWPETLVEIDLRGKVLRTAELRGFEDTEAIVYLGSNRYAITEEARRQVVILTIDPQAEVVNREDGQIITLDLTHDPRKGFEGLAYNPADGSLYIANEDEPRALYRVAGVVKGDGPMSVHSPWSMDDNPLHKGDLSGLHFDVNRGNLLILSDDSRALTEVRLSGEPISRLSLRFYSDAGLEETIPQPEGVTMDAGGNLYIVSEPNLFYRLAPSEETPVSGRRARQ